MLGTAEQERAVRRYAATYAFSCAPNMAAVGAALASADIHTTAELGHLQLQLQDNLRKFDGLIPTETVGSPLPIRIFRIGDEAKTIATAEHLLRNGHYCSAVFFPTVPQGRAALRMAVTAAHQADDLADLALYLASSVRAFA